MFSLNKQVPNKQEITTTMRKEVIDAAFLENHRHVLCLNQLVSHPDGEGLWLFYLQDWKSLSCQCHAS